MRFRTPPHFYSEVPFFVVTKQWQPFSHSQALATRDPPCEPKIGSQKRGVEKTWLRMQPPRQGSEQCVHCVDCYSKIKQVVIFLQLTTSQPELGGNPVSLRAPNRPLSGSMAFLGHLGLNTIQKSKGKAKNPATQRGSPMSPRVHCLPPGPGAVGRLLLLGWYPGWF
jgi:hypothetical protein